MVWQRYFQRFFFSKPVIIEDLPEGQRDMIEAYPDRIVIGIPPGAEKSDMAEILSLAKMGEKDYLLTTFYFQPDMTRKEEHYCNAFFQLCKPLQPAWAYKTMRNYLPEVYEREMDRIIAMYEAIKDNVANNREIVLGMFAIVAENPDGKADMELRVPENRRAEWEQYLNLIRDYARMEPDVGLYIRLAEETRAPYVVKVATDKDGFRYFEVREGRKI
jgi:hypothetical protein